LSGLMDIGSSTISSGTYLRLVPISRYNYKQFHGSTGFQWTLSDADRKTFSGWFLSGGADFSLGELPLTADLFYRVNPYSSLTKESNLGFIFTHERKHIDIHFGYHMRSYSLSSASAEVSDLSQDADLKIREYRNFIYRGSLKLKQDHALWNAAISLTNYDYFNIQQETNPMLLLNGYYNIKPGLSLNSELWYQGAGMLNLHPNRYGLYFRIGMTWRLGQ
jgi:hypothetical protein